MAFTNSHDYLTGRKPVPTPAGSEVLSVRFTLAMPTAHLQQNDCGAIGLLPPGCVPVDVMVDGTAMDSSTAALVLQVGILNTRTPDLQI